MREILFRGQIRRNGEKVNMAGEPLPSIWKYGSVSPYGGVIYQAEPEFKKFPVYYDTVGQYTGMMDKNGVKIFDGDIIQDVYCESIKYVVEYSSERCGFIPFAHGDGCGCCEVATIHDSTCCEVIGNIYDNPELLEEGNK